MSLKRSDRQCIDFASIEANMPDLRSRFHDSQPFPHLVIDGFLFQEVASKITKGIPTPTASDKSSDYIFAKNKYENPRYLDTSSDLLTLKAELISPRFSNILTDIYGCAVFVDPDFLGGGLHLGGRGSFLDMHADFTRHGVHREWLRELNIILYLNENYDPNWGGGLDIYNSETGISSTIAPIFNRAVIMLTKPHTIHGYKKINFPEGTFRTSIASYAYSINDNFEETPFKSTAWHPEGAVARHLIVPLAALAVKFKNKLFGSRTANRSKKRV